MLAAALHACATRCAFIPRVDRLSATTRGALFTRTPTPPATVCGYAVDNGMPYTRYRLPSAIFRRADLGAFASMLRATLDAEGISLPVTLPAPYSGIGGTRTSYLTSVHLFY